MIDLNYMHTIGIRDYLYENEMVTGLEGEGGRFLIDFERKKEIKKDETKEDMHLHNKFKHTRIYLKISDELHKMEDIIQDYKKIDGAKRRKSDSMNYLAINFDGYKQKSKSTIQNLRGNKISNIRKAMLEDKKKEKIRRRIETTLRKLHIEKRMSCKTYKNYLIYVLENFDVMDAQELKEELTMIQQEFKPSRLATSWEAHEHKKNDDIHIKNQEQK